MCSLAVANYFWNHEKPSLKGAELVVSYDNRYGKSTNKYYKVELDTVTPTKLTGWYRHSSGSTRCQVEVTRPSVSDDSNLRIEHSVQHVASLVEEVTFRKKALNGYHRNSLMYGRFNATLHDSTWMTLDCEVKQPNGQFRWTSYTVKILSEYT